MEKNIGFNDKYKFGVEIEFANDEKILDEIYYDSLKYFIPIKFQINHKLYLIFFNRWILDHDLSVSKNINGKYYGGEVSSRILTDDIESWKELKKICKLLKSNNSYIDTHCGGHINIDISSYLNNPKFFEVLYKTIIVYEDEISKFYMGDMYKIRDSKEKYAKSMKDRLFNNINKVNFYNKDFIENIRENSLSFRIEDGINFFKLYKSSLMEIRYPNSSLNPNIIQNNINFSLSLISAIGEDKIDLDFLNYLIKAAKKNKEIFYNDFNNYFEKNKKFDYLINQISLNENSKNNFNSQYQKVLKKTSY